MARTKITVSVEKEVIDSAKLAFICFPGTLKDMLYPKLVGIGSAWRTLNVRVLSSIHPRASKGIFTPQI
jgi:hypothetical protein